MDLFLKLRTMEFLWWPGLVLLYNWQEPDLCTCPSWTGPPHIASSGLVLDIYGKLSIVLWMVICGKYSFQFLTASVHGP